MLFLAPRCYDCTKFLHRPKSMIELASCKEYHVIPKSIYFENENCNKYIYDESNYCTDEYNRDEIVSELIEKVIENKEKLSYVNLDTENKYLGWTYDFKLKLPDNNKMWLDLRLESDLFLLFVLASAWSKTGQWENAAFFVTYLKMENKGNPEYWLSDSNLEYEIMNKDTSVSKVIQLCTGIVPRKKVSFRRDYFASLKVLATNWNDIVDSLIHSQSNQDYLLFIDYISTLNGLGTGENKMRIKIPLILRELRCQNIFANIKGEYCCVPDERVKMAAFEIGLGLPIISNYKSVFKASKIIYDNFGDLYDIPLFAYEDLKG
jgi:hypothetical protein